MVLAAAKPAPANCNGSRLNGETSVFALAHGAASASHRGGLRAGELMAQKRARLMLAAKCAVYVSDAVPVGKFTIVDPATMSDSSRSICPFKVKTLVVHPDDIERATRHFSAQAKETAQ